MLLDSCHVPCDAECLAPVSSNYALCMPKYPLQEAILLDSGKENGNYYSELGLYWDTGKKMETTIVSWALGCRRVLAELALRFLFQEFVKVIHNRSLGGSFIQHGKAL